MRRRGLMRLRSGELIALAGAACLIAGMLLPAYDRAGGGSLSLWATFGPAAAFVMLAGVGAIAVAASAIFERSSAVPIATAVWATWGAIAGVIAAIVRVLERPTGAGGVAAGGWLLLAGALLCLVGCWGAMRDERTDAYEPPTVAPKPPPTPGGAASSDAGAPR
ncbi:MAG TPA: hypothetical protein VKU89_06815 [Solirubrobacteraceae bacterium]|nr:hypothetical protein [Solirubrobacteraceae bacterium]